jgi:protein ImuA
MSSPASSTVFARLQQELQAMGGLRKPGQAEKSNGKLSIFEPHFPQGQFPIGAIHEFRAGTSADTAVSSAFITALMSACLPAEALVCWISEQPQIYAPALASFCFLPHQVFFVQAASAKNRQYCIEEALRCSSIHAVVAELPQLDFTQSRRFQLAVEKSAVTGFMINAGAKSCDITGAVSRWSIAAMPSMQPQGMPGVGHPCWRVQLEKMRHGKPGNWVVEWVNGNFKTAGEKATILPVWKSKTG